jgi:hypothetical protein
MPLSARRALERPPNPRVQSTALAGAIEIGRFLMNAFPVYHDPSRRGGG